MRTLHKLIVYLLRLLSWANSAGIVPVNKLSQIRKSSNEAKFPIKDDIVPVKRLKSRRKSNNRVFSYIPFGTGPVSSLLWTCNRNKSKLDMSGNVPCKLLLYKKSESEMIERKNHGELVGNENK